MGYVRANQPVAIHDPDNPGGPLIPIDPAVVYRDDDPIVKARPDLFSEVRADDEPETATKAPGEKRATKRS